MDEFVSGSIAAYSGGDAKSAYNQIRKLLLGFQKYLKPNQQVGVFALNTPLAEVVVVETFYRLDGLLAFAGENEAGEPAILVQNPGAIMFQLIAIESSKPRQAIGFHTQIPGD